MATELDHRVPLFKGGEDVEGNRQGLCAACHDAKTHDDFGWQQRQTIGADGWPVD